MDAGEPFPGHRGWSRTFVRNALTLGLVLPAEATRGGPPSLALLSDHARVAEELGFAALWVRDATLMKADFPDHGQLLDPWVALAHLCSQTEEIALGVASIVLPIRHPLQVATAALSIDLLSGRRLLVGLGNGYRPAEYRAVGREHADRGELFRDSFAYLARLVRECQTTVDSRCGHLGDDARLVLAPREPLPLLLTGDCSQPTEVAAALGDGRIWLADPELAQEYAALAERVRPGRFSPYITLIRIDLGGDPRFPGPPTLARPRRLGAEALIELLQELREAGVHHVILDTRWSTKPVDRVLAELAERVLPAFHAGGSTPRGSPRV